MAEESEEPSDGMTQQSQEKPQWVRPLWLLPGFLLLLVGSLPWLSTVLPQWGTMLRQWGTILWQWCLGSWQWVLFLLLRLSGFLLLLKVVWPWLSTVLPQWGKKLSQKRKAAGRWCKEWMGRLPLFVAIAIWAVLGIIAFLLAMWWLGRVPFWQLKLDPRKHAENIVKIALTLVGGVGAVAYLVIKYQERQQAGRAEKREKDRTVDTKVQDAINQLGSDKASTRIAGVYALTDIADRYKGGYRQRVVDILCGYLRSDRSSYAPDRSGQPVWDASGHLVESVASDEAVESTILSVMRDRLRKERKDDETGETIVQTVDDDQLWCACTFDLHEATFHEAVDLRYSTFECVPNFRGTKFERNADFRGATFTGNAHFVGATFTDGADFVGATFTDGADFGGATFTRGAYADFGGAEFRASAAFSGIQGQPSFRFETCKFNRKFRWTNAYEWGPIPTSNDGLPAGAVWEDF
ncbi:pentapeptide repeat-containing protein [Bifidobacterium angulatum]|uniref:pentapeptide repeat-containing protein n=1 Tax=Bifidobacterium angulatum TaxID=1683 RepID=UPI002E77FD18|nr:pentapeptide repeat-containing protein [Bifidobacterium angulatum]MEE0333039.1 pentapeptide repeat-containing protein [Bifidobacterium angulatum]